MKKIFTAEQKTSVAVAALKERQTVNQISAAYEVHPTQVGLWKKQAIQGLKDIFSEIDFCLENLERALKERAPLIHNSDQGSHFTSPRYTDLLTAKDIQISMDGRGRCMDNIFTERLWRSVKYENIYLKSYCDIDEAQRGLTDYFRFYNHVRPHQSLNNMTPSRIFQKISKIINHYQLNFHLKNLF